MKASELRKLVGREIEWLDDYDTHRGNYAVRRAALLDVQGKNVLIDDGGGTDRKWLPNMHQVLLAEEKGRP